MVRVREMYAGFGGSRNGTGRRAVIAADERSIAPVSYGPDFQGV